MASTFYDNTVIENTVTDIMNTQLDASNLLTVDNSLAMTDGLVKSIHKYTYTGTVEELEKGASNTTYGEIAPTITNYTVKRYQHAFKYNDVDAMTDSAAIDYAVSGCATVMANKIKTDYFAELAKISNKFTYSHGTKANYSTFVDALAQINQEVENGLFIVMGNDMKTVIRKDSDFITSKQGDILYTGQFGSIAGIPVIFSKLVPAGNAYITRKDAVRFFVKKDGQVENKRDVETKDNVLVYTRYGLVALVDDSKSIVISEATA